MVTAIRTKSGGRRRYLYITERMESMGLGDADVAGRVGVARETIYRWRTEQHRLNPEKIASLADALNCHPTDLWKRPGRPSLDAMIEDAPDDVQDTAVDIVVRLVAGGRKGS